MRSHIQFVVLLSVLFLSFACDNNIPRENTGLETRSDSSVGHETIVVLLGEIQSDEGMLVQIPMTAFGALEGATVDLYRNDQAFFRGLIADDYYHSGYDAVSFIMRPVNDDDTVGFEVKDVDGSSLYFEGIVNGGGTSQAVISIKALTYGSED